jgi:hypothetical protein
MSSTILIGDRSNPNPKRFGFIRFRVDGKTAKVRKIKGGHSVTFVDSETAVAEESDRTFCFSCNGIHHQEVCDMLCVPCRQEFERGRKENEGKTIKDYIDMARSRRRNK